MFLKLGEWYIDIDRVSAYRIYKEGDHYRLTFYIEGKEFLVDKTFKSENEVHDWLDDLHLYIPDLSLSDTVILDDLNEKNLKTKVLKKAKGLKENFLSFLAFTLFIFFLISLITGMVFILKIIWNLVDRLLNSTQVLH
ncbi:MAG: hypothetical protein ABGX27_01425 [Desulfurobacteriaceae bacterium]